MEFLKNKKLLILSVLVVGIWGIIGYRIYDQMQDDAPVAVRPSRTPVQTVAETNTYTLSLSYPDPFLRQQVKPVVAVKKSVAPKVQRPVVATAPSVMINWSLLQYRGMISNATRKKKTAIVQYSGKDYIVGEGEEIDGFKVLEVHADSIRFGMDSQTKYIKKKVNP
ncbi:hypothetical protein KK062_20075 [Fulvivirgaceae bacterium PWU5]|uniref:Type II secretion system protein GspC N-terminal domain-containing protein n=1 Tax=Dawidia cretensis TaxID=2782350 RepID=A0AAP2E207_9BACT|nr:hypothetical protein [Dawidia cretensis]MBT1710553.1 hypothetical protein [Dawidia cretensis]